MSGIAATGLRRRHSHSLGSEQTQTSPERPAERLLASIVSPDRGSQFLPASITGALFYMLLSIDLSQLLRGSESFNQTLLLPNNSSHPIEGDTFIGPSLFQLSTSNVSTILDYNHTTGNSTSFAERTNETTYYDFGPLVVLIGAGCLISACITNNKFLLGNCRSCLASIITNPRNGQNTWSSFSFPRIQNSFFNIVSFQTQTDRLYSNYETNYEKLDGNQQKLLDDYLREQNFLCPFIDQVFKNPCLGDDNNYYEHFVIRDPRIGVRGVNGVKVTRLTPNTEKSEAVKAFLTDFNTNPKAFIERLGNSSANTSQNSRGDQVDDSSDDDLEETIAGNVSGGGGNCFMPLGSCTEE